MDELTIVLTTARRHNVDEATIIYTSKIDVKEGVYLKAKLEANDNWSEHNLPPEETRNLLREYKRAVLVIGDSNKQDLKSFRTALLDIELSLVLNNFHKALVLVPGNHDLSEESKSLNNGKCHRIPLECCGIDIFSTVKKFKKNIENYIHFKKNPYVGIILLD